MLTATYVVLAVLGCGYVVLSAFLGHMGDQGGSGDGGDGGGDGGGAHDAGAAHDAGGHSGDMHYGVDASGHGHAVAGAGSAAVFHFPFFSPLALAAMLGSLGGYGLMFRTGLDVSDGMSLLMAVPAAFATAYAVTYASFKLLMSSRGSSQIRMSEIEGAAGEVITPIPEGGLGEVAALVAGQRYTGPAREEQGKAVGRGAHVKVVRLLGSTMVVKAEGPRPSS